MSKVDHSHIVPVGYLKQFAGDDSRIGTVLVDSGKTVYPGVRDAGVRGGGYYKRTRPKTGERSDDVETYSIQAIEDDAIPILCDPEAHWPLSGDHKVKVAMFFALQLLRGPRWFEWHRDFTLKNMEEYRRAGAFTPAADEHGATVDDVHRANEEFFLSSTQKLMTMLFLTASVTSTLGSMNWARVRFARPSLITCDHPVVVWPMTDRGRRPQPTVPGSVGVINFLEVRVPVSAHEAFLMTWRDLPDEAEPIQGSRHHAEALNAFTRAEGDKQWFFKPETRPRFASGLLTPLSAELLDDYDTAAALGAELRRRVHADLTARVGSRSRKAEIHYLPQPTKAGIAAPIRR